MDKKVVDKIFAEFDAMTPEELRADLLKGKGKFASIITEGGFLEARSESYVQDAYGVNLVPTTAIVPLAFFTSSLTVNTQNIGIGQVLGTEVFAKDYPLFTISPFPGGMIVDGSTGNQPFFQAANNFDYALAA